MRKLFAALVMAVGLGALLAPVTVQAEQIRLADGRYLQGEVGEVTEEGFEFKLTETGGKVFLRWNQVDDGLRKRLRNEQDPDEGLNLEVLVDGARLELISGEVREGKITRTGNAYTVVNFDKPRGETIPADEVVEEGFVTGIQIDATVMMSEVEALALAEQERSPLETAKQFYEMARIADRFALYEEAKDYVALALAAGPDAKLQARLTEYDAKLEELIRQKGLLTALVAARQLAKKKSFQPALDVLNDAKEEFKPTDAVLEKWDETFAEIDMDFTKFVIAEWYKQMKPAAQKKVKEKDITVQDALNWARREMDLEIQRRIGAIVGSEDLNNIKSRFVSRFDLADTKVLKLSTRKASFGEDGFYQIVGGHLPVAGKQPAPESTQPGPQPGNNGNGNRGRSRGGDGDREGDETGDAREFQQGPKLPEGISPDDIKDILRRALEKDGEEEGAKSGGEGTSPVKQDISKLKVPEVVPPMTEWWDKGSSTTRARWLVAVYVKFAGTMRVLELDRWDVKYR